MKFEVVTPPEKEPISLDEVKMHLRSIPGDETEDDAILSPLITAAREFCENRTGRSFGVQTLAAYPPLETEYIRLPRPPLVQIEQIQVKKADGTEETLSADQYEADTVGGGVFVHWPKEQFAQINPIRVLYKTGYQENLPKTIRQAMLLLIGHWYENRETVVIGAFTSIEIEMTVKALLNQYRVWWF